MIRSFMTTTLEKTIQIPSSKSQTLRAILLASLATGTSIIHSFLPSLDAFSMIEACRNLGATIHVKEDCLYIEGVCSKINGSKNVIDAGNSGLVLRFISTIAALSKDPIVITGDESIRSQRSMKEILSALNQMGANAISTRNNQLAPLIIQGRVNNQEIIVDGQDSQNVSALLFLAIFLPGTTKIHVKNAGERPWVTLTLSWLKKLGVNYRQEGFDYFEVDGIGEYNGFEYKVPGDWSSTAFPIIAALIKKQEITLCNLDYDDPQGDKKIVDILESMGAKFIKNHEAKTLTVLRTDALKGVEVDINDCIDVIAALSVVACYVKGTILIKNAQIARGKECDRIQCIATELKKLNVNVVENSDGLAITGGSINGGKVSSHNDHRLAMAFTIAGFGSKDKIVVDDIDCIAKTYPNFFEMVEYFNS